MPESRRRVPIATVLFALLTLTACGDGTDEIEDVIEDPAKMRGRSADDIQNLFGAPTFRRRDGDARIWQYTTDLCQLDLFLYPRNKSKDKTLAVVHFEVRNHGGRSVSSGLCLGSVAARRDVSG